MPTCFPGLQIRRDSGILSTSLMTADRKQSLPETRLRRSQHPPLCLHLHSKEAGLTSLSKLILTNSVPNTRARLSKISSGRRNSQTRVSHRYSYSYTPVHSATMGASWLGDVTLQAQSSHSADLGVLAKNRSWLMYP